MGLDASVRCRCFEENRLLPGPVPYDDLYVDEEGYLSSMTLDDARGRLDSRQFDARYGQLEEDFMSWEDHSCEHEWGACCSERVANWAGVSEFEDLVREAGGEDAFPLLSHLLPHANGGSYPASLAESTLAELDRFVEVVTDIDDWVLCDADSGEEVWRSTGCGSFTWMYAPGQRIGMAGGRVFFDGPGGRLETAHFRQEPMGEPDRHGMQRMRIVCLDQEAETTAFDSIGPEESPHAAREFHVVSRKAPYLYEGRYWTAESIRNLLLASIDTGNPIRWE